MIFLAFVSRHVTAFSSPCTMTVRTFAGHSKWAKIARGKGSSDAARSILFAKISKGITAAVKAGGLDIASNLRLAGLVDAARKASCPKDIVERAMRAKETVSLTEVQYEVTASGGAAIIIDCLTDNVRRLAPALRYICTQNNAQVAAPGAAAWQFVTRARISIALTNQIGTDERSRQEAALLDASINLGAVDVDFPSTTLEDEGEQNDNDDDDNDNDDKDTAVVWAEPSLLSSIRIALLKDSFDVTSASLIRVPTSYVTLEGIDNDSFGDLLTSLEEHEDVQNIVHNAKSD